MSHTLQQAEIHTIVSRRRHNLRSNHANDGASAGHTSFDNKINRISYIHEPSVTSIQCEPEKVIRLMIELFNDYGADDVRLSRKGDGSYDITLLEPSFRVPWYKKLSMWLRNNDRRCCGRYILRIPTEPSKVHYEVTTLMYMARKFDFPVPELAAYSNNHDNALGRAFVLEKHLSGQPLHTLWTSLNFEQRKSAVRCIAQVFNSIHSITNPCAGLISIQNTTQDIKQDLPRIEPFSISTPSSSFSSSSSSSATSPRLATPQTPYKHLLSLCTSRALTPQTPSFPHIWSNFTRLTNALHALRLLPDTQLFHLHNPSLTPHTLLLRVEDPCSVAVSGITAWKDAVFAPGFVSTRAPWGDVLAEDVTREEWVECMLVFYDAVGDEYARSEERREFVLARLMWEVLVGGIREGRDVRVAEGVAREWDKLHGRGG